MQKNIQSFVFVKIIIIIIKKGVICLISVAYVHNHLTPFYKYALKLLSSLSQFFRRVSYMLVQVNCPIVLPNTLYANLTTN
jgi:hypothetical protein